MSTDRPNFLAGSSQQIARAADANEWRPANQNVKWAVSLALWSHLPPCSFTDILEVMKDTGFIGIRLTGYPGFLQHYNLTAQQLHRELSQRNLHVASMSWGGPLHDPAERQNVLQSARDAMKFLADFGASHLVVFPPDRAHSSTPGAFEEVCARCNQIGELAGEMGFTAGLHHHLGLIVENQDEIDRFMSLTDPKLFGLSPDTAHLHLVGCDAAASLQKYKDRIHFLDYKDAKWTAPIHDWIEPNGKVFAKGSTEARFYNSIYDLGDGEIDFSACHRVLEGVSYRGWICVDLDTARHGALSSYRRCSEYAVRVLEPIYI